MSTPEINPCPKCGEPCRIVQVRCDRVVVCCTYPTLEFCEDNIHVRILHGCGYTSPMERHPVDCIERHNRETKEATMARKKKPDPPADAKLGNAVTLDGMFVRDHFGKSIDLSKELEALGLRMVWSPKGWAVYEAHKKTDYDAVTAGTTMEELQMFVRGAKYGYAYAQEED